MSSLPSPRRRGAPAGNLNALKHGFYSRQFRRTEHKDLEALSAIGLDSEINMLRVITRRVFELADESLDFETGLKFVTVMSITAARLARLLSTQSRLGVDSKNEVHDDIIQAIEEIGQELKP